MPFISIPNNIDIAPEKFLQNCSREELIEIDLLIQSPHYRMKMTGTYTQEAKPKVLRKYPEFPEQLLNNI